MKMIRDHIEDIRKTQADKVIYQFLKRILVMSRTNYNIINVTKLNDLETFCSVFCWFSITVKTLI